MKRRESTYYLTVLLAITALLLLPLVTAVAQTRDSLHTVKEGETLFSIARKYDVSLSQLREWNELEGNELSIGQELVVAKLPDPKDSTIHTVKKNETLFSISKRYGVSIAELKAWNNLENNNLEIGQKLRIYGMPSDEREVEESLAAEDDSENTTEGEEPEPEADDKESIVVDKPEKSNTYYTVKSGDSLYEIALAHNMTVQELKALNDLQSDIIRIGQKLTVEQPESAPSVAESASESSPLGQFVKHSVQEGERLGELLNRFRMDTSEFRQLNPELDDYTLRTGQKITVLAPPTNINDNPYTIEASLQNLGNSNVSVYDSTEYGNTTTSGELYNPNALTAAHSNINLGDIIFVQNENNSKGIYIRINDRFSGSGLKLSRAAFDALDFASGDSARVRIYQEQ